ncbi:SEC14-like protein 2 [Folsomia candida]|uniref:SEC14-like protein 2 n=1 Tax=Folsomia candida TaxID=158441 RepID=UPI001604C423|nr:SEC14-like protein 2 [Folsomia candida]
MNSFVTLAILVAFGVLGVCQAVSVQEDVTLTRKQKAVLDQFKESVKGRLPQEYMYEDIYLIRWLRAKDFRLKDAENMIMQNVAWRKENQMDNVLKEDWSDFRKEYKYWIDGVDKEGRPILIIDVGEWDLRKASVTGQAKRLGRYIDSIYEEINEKVRTMRLVEGKNVTQYLHIFDLGGFNLAQMGCSTCIPLATRVVTTYETHYPGNQHKTVLVNTPGPFQTLLQILRPLMSQNTRDTQFIYGKKEEGAEALLKDINADQLAVEFGGTRVLPNYS